MAKKLKQPKNTKDSRLSEYERLISGITRVRNRQHIAWIAQATRLALEDGSARLPASQEARIPVEAFYSWFRAGLPTETTALWATPAETLLTTLKAAIEQNVIPSSCASDLDGIAKRIEQIKNHPRPSNSFSTAP